MGGAKQRVGKDASGAVGVAAPTTKGARKEGATVEYMSSRRGPNRQGASNSKTRSAMPAQDIATDHDVGAFRSKEKVGDVDETIDAKSRFRRLARRAMFHS